MQNSTKHSAKPAASTLKVMGITTLRILGYRQKQFDENAFQRLTGIQVGIACLMALLGFTAIIALLAIAAVTVWG